MPLILVGNTTKTVLASSSIPVSAPTQVWSGGRFKLLESIDHNGNAALFRFGPTGGGAYLTFAGIIPNTTIKLNFRFWEKATPEASNSSIVSATNNITINVGQEYEWLVVADLNAGYVRMYLDNVQVLERLKPSEATWSWYNSPTAAIVPTIEGANFAGKNWEISDFVGCVGGVISGAEAESFSFASGNAGTLSAPPVWGIKPLGVSGVYAVPVEDVYGSRDMTQTAGTVPPDEGFPYLTGLVADADLTAEITAITAKTMTIAGDAGATGGTVYVVGDYSDEWGGMPNPEHIENGVLNDGVTAARVHEEIAIIGGEFSQAITQLLANQNYTLYVVYKDSEGEFGDIVTLTGKTKRPVIKPSGEYVKWHAVDDSLLVSESGMSMKVWGSEYTQGGITTNSSGEGEVSLVGYLNSGADVDIGDEITIALTRSNGESLLITETIVAGE